MGRNHLRSERLPPILGAIYLGALGLLTGCATPGEGEPPEEQVRERAIARLDAYVSRDFEAAYRFLAPGYRSSVSAADYAAGHRQRQIRWEAFELQDVNCEAQRCTVGVRVKYSVSTPHTGRRSNWRGVDETWVRTEGGWWYVPPS